MSKMKYIVSSLQTNNNPNMTEKDKLLFADFMLNKSPWSPLFVEQTPQEVVEDGMWIIDGNNPANYIANACVATRIISEFPHRFQAWKRLISVGVEEALAFFICHWVASSHKDHGDYLGFSGTGGHTCFEYGFNKNYFTNYITRKLCNMEGKMSEGTGYLRIANIWGNSSNKITSGTLSKFIFPRQDGKVINYDIFYRGKEGEKYFTSDYEVEHMAKDFVSFVNERG